MDRCIYNSCLGDAPYRGAGWAALGGHVKIAADRQPRTIRFG